ncbi:hypothetical protein MKK64_18325 [Methylobacterium sp. E-025]|uniref:hypothetical protein n=1 Tax=Methylobacterium sp. E-025 TaxID=2836561 RepID=UPI001FBBE4A3|nr:hypothetical protein [Methylobacterium sp. E-025]MCJ2113139.1 hypothetical protein [Methylobacterium sp. E-025]
MRLPKIGRFGRRFAVILSGELIQSLFHFVLNIMLVRELGAHGYGLFAIVFTIGAVGVTYIRALVAVPATLFLARSLGRPAERGHDMVFGSGATAVALLMAAAVSIGLAPVLGVTALAGGAFVGLYAFRSYLRIVLLARRAPWVAGASDMVYSACGLALVVFLHAGDDALLEHAFLGIAAAHAAGIAVALAAIGRPVRVSFRASVRRRYLEIWRTLAWSLLGVTGTTVQGQGLTLLFALLAGPAAYAPIAATLVLFAPLRIPTNALNNMVLPEISALLAAGRRREARRLVVRSTALIGLACLAYGVAMWTALPIIERHLFNGRFASEPMAAIGFGVWCVVTIALLYAIPRAFLEASAAFRVIAAGALVSAGIGFLIMVPLLLTLAPPFALIGLAVSECVTALWSAKAFRDRSRHPDGRVREAADRFAAGTSAPAAAA